MYGRADGSTQPRTKNVGISGETSLAPTAGLFFSELHDLLGSTKKTEGTEKTNSIPSVYSFYSVYSVVKLFERGLGSTAAKCVTIALAASRILKGNFYDDSRQF